VTALFCIVGPTATGKSNIALDLAEKINAEIINADAMQFYRGMEIGTAKLSMVERRGIPHHLIDNFNLQDEASVSEYQANGRVIIDRLLDEAIPVVVVGGSGLYVKALLDPLNFPGRDPQIRERLEVEALELGAAAMHARLAKVDPAAALAILPGNVRRVVRALEVMELTGAPFTATLPRDGESRYPEAIQIGLQIERSVLNKRIDLRVDQMWSAGLVEEVKQLSFVGLREGKTARRALGYLQILQALDGNTSLESARAETKAATRKYARRQISWFRRDNRISWVEPENAVEHAISMLPESYRSDGRIIK